MAPKASRQRLILRDRKPVHFKDFCDACCERKLRDEVIGTSNNKKDCMWMCGSCVGQVERLLRVPDSEPFDPSPHPVLFYFCNQAVPPRLHAVSCGPPYGENGEYGPIRYAAKCTAACVGTRPGLNGAVWCPRSQLRHCTKCFTLAPGGYFEGAHCKTCRGTGATAQDAAAAAAAEAAAAAVIFGAGTLGGDDLLLYGGAGAVQAAAAPGLSGPAAYYTAAHLGGGQPEHGSLLPLGYGQGVPGNIYEGLPQAPNPQEDDEQLERLMRQYSMSLDAQRQDDMSDSSPGIVQQQALDPWPSSLSATTTGPGTARTMTPRLAHAGVVMATGVALRVPTALPAAVEGAGMGAGPLTPWVVQGPTREGAATGDATPATAAVPRQGVTAAAATAATATPTTTAPFTWLAPVGPVDTPILAPATAPLPALASTLAGPEVVATTVAAPTPIVSTTLPTTTFNVVTRHPAPWVADPVQPMPASPALGGHQEPVQGWGLEQARQASGFEAASAHSPAGQQLDAAALQPAHAARLPMLDVDLPGISAEDLLAAMVSPVSADFLIPDDPFIPDLAVQGVQHGDTGQKLVEQQASSSEQAATAAAAVAAAVATAAAAVIAAGAAPPGAAVATAGAGPMRAAPPAATTTAPSLTTRQAPPSSPPIMHQGACGQANTELASNSRRRTREEAAESVGVLLHFQDQVLPAAIPTSIESCAELKMLLCEEVRAAGYEVDEHTAEVNYFWVADWLRIRRDLEVSRLWRLYYEGMTFMALWLKVAGSAKPDCFSYTFTFQSIKLHRHSMRVKEVRMTELGGGVQQLGAACMAAGSVNIDSIKSDGLLQPAQGLVQADAVSFIKALACQRPFNQGEVDVQYESWLGKLRDGVLEGDITDISADPATPRLRACQPSVVSYESLRRDQGMCNILISGSGIRTECQVLCDGDSGSVLQLHPVISWRSGPGSEASGVCAATQATLAMSDGCEPLYRLLSMYVKSEEGVCSNRAFMVLVKTEVEAQQLRKFLGQWAEESQRNNVAALVGTVLQLLCNGQQSCEAGMAFRLNSSPVVLKNLLSTTIVLRQSYCDYMDALNTGSGGSLGDGSLEHANGNLQSSLQVLFSIAERAARKLIQDGWPSGKPHAVARVDRQENDRAWIRWAAAVLDDLLVNNEPQNVVPTQAAQAEVDTELAAVFDKLWITINAELVIPEEQLHFDKVLAHGRGKGKMWCGSLKRPGQVLPVAIKALPLVLAGPTSNATLDTLKHELTKVLCVEGACDGTCMCYGVCSPSKGPAAGSLCVIVQLCQWSLPDLVSANRHLDLPTSLEVAHNMAGSLQRLHERNLTHLDLMPSNVLLDEAFKPILSDFGVAAVLDRTGSRQLLATNNYSGAPNYMAPEQFLADGVSFPADIWALGCMILYMLTGEAPWKGMSMGQICGQVLQQAKPVGPDSSWPDALKTLLTSCFAFAPEDRPTAGQACEELQRILKGLKVQGTPPTSEPQVKALPGGVEDGGTSDWERLTKLSPEAQAIMKKRGVKPAVAQRLVGKLGCSSVQDLANLVPGQATSLGLDPVECMVCKKLMEEVKRDAIEHLQALQAASPVCVGQRGQHSQHVEKKAASTVSEKATPGEAGLMKQKLSADASSEQELGLQSLQQVS